VLVQRVMQVDATPVGHRQVPAIHADSDWTDDLYSMILTVENRRCSPGSGSTGREADTLEKAVKECLR
jgi:hypothetical protein